MTDINTDNSDSGIEAADLDTFSADLFSAVKPTEVADTNEESEDGAESKHTSQGNEADTANESDEADDSDEGDEANEGDDPEEAPVKGKKKSRFQERIDDLTAKLRDRERQAEEADARLAKALAKLEEVATEKTVDTQNKNNNTQKTDQGLVEPTADDVLEDGSPKYPLGEFDPKLLRDLTRYDRAIERDHEMKVAEENRERAVKAAELDTLQTKWNTKVESAKEIYPDYVEKGQTLINSLQDVPAEYGVFLTQNIMSMDYGTDVFYYLAEHPEEARVIANSSPEKALNRLGRIEARFEIAADERSGKETKLRVTQTPAPPATRTKGSNAQAPSVDLENADLDAFASELFKRRR